VSEKIVNTWQAAWQRAVAERLIVYKERPGQYRVKDYTIVVTGRSWTNLSCDCQAGQHGNVCKHAAAVVKAIQWGIHAVPGTEKKGVQA
jgi:hypothetical protein